MDSAELGKVVECTATTPLAEATLIEGEIPDPFGLESIRPTKQPSNETEAYVPNQEITQLIKQVVSPSTVELERLISELQQARAYLDSEGERIERETQRYLQLSQTTVESVKIISDAVSEWRKAGHPVKLFGVARTRELHRCAFFDCRTNSLWVNRFREFIGWGHSYTLESEECRD